MGEVRRLEDVAGRRGGRAPDLTPSPLPIPAPSGSLKTLVEEIRSIRAELDKIKRALRAHGIPVE